MASREQLQGGVKVRINERTPELDLIGLTGIVEYQTTPEFTRVILDHGSEDLGYIVALPNDRFDLIQ